MDEQQIDRYFGIRTKAPLFPVVAYNVDNDAVIVVLRQPRDHGNGNDPFHPADSNCKKEGQSASQPPTRCSILRATTRQNDSLGTPPP